MYICVVYIDRRFHCHYRYLLGSGRCRSFAFGVFPVCLGGNKIPTNNGYRSIISTAAAVVSFSVPKSSCNYVLRLCLSSELRARSTVVRATYRTVDWIRPEIQRKQTIEAFIFTKSYTLLLLFFFNKPH